MENPKIKWYNRFVIKHEIVCFLKGHKTSHRYYPNTTDICFRCWREIDDWFITIPSILQGLYCWICEREWKWFDKLDIWLCDHFKMPDWWEF